jgi:alkylhydroperoxidase family enzyme
MNDKVFGELMVIVATANATNRLANGYQIPVDEQFRI